MISADTLLSNLGKSTGSPEVQKMLQELGLPDVPELEGGVGDAEAPAHGIAMFFSIAHHVRNVDGPKLSSVGTNDERHGGMVIVLRDAMPGRRGSAPATQISTLNRWRIS